MKPQYLFIVITGLFVLLFFMQKEPKVINTVKGAWDISAEVNTMGYDNYLIIEKDFDYNEDSIFSLAKMIKSTTETPKAAITETIKYVATNVRYTTVELNYCYTEKASDVLAAGIGDCVSMSRAVTALLRAQGIPARTMGGCISFKNKCNPLMAAVPGLEPKVTTMQTGDFKKRGFLHEWVEVWEPVNGWMLVEATAGITYDMDCASYIEYQYDKDAVTRCEIRDQSFWNLCAEA